eukprot:5548668-Amphidinium_carterae.1
MDPTRSGKAELDAYKCVPSVLLAMEKHVTDARVQVLAPMGVGYQMRKRKHFNPFSSCQLPHSFCGFEDLEEFLF